jgi:hypothetical protein
VQIDPEDFKRHYALLSDDALLEIDRDELVDAARPYYDAELTERKLAPPEAEESVSPNSTDSAPGQTADGLQLVATFLCSKKLISREAYCSRPTFRALSRMTRPRRGPESAS